MIMTIMICQKLHMSFLNLYNVTQNCKSFSISYIYRCYLLLFYLYVYIFLVFSGCLV